ncbi:MAG: thioredoxin-disulfide reductase [Candidatus Woesearchaeota archaeon]
MTEKEQYDVLIVGGGPSGMSAAIYTARKKLKTAIVSIDFGGQGLLTSHIENYPGVISESGPRLMKNFEEQAKHFGAEFIYGKIIKIEKLAEKKFKVIQEDKTEYYSKTLILSFGKVAKTLNIPGESKFLGRGVSTCAVCDGPLFKNKNVAVIGGGNSAINATEELAAVAKKVYLIHRRKDFRADEIGLEKIKNMKNVELVLEAIPVAINGKMFVESIDLEDVNTKKRKNIAVNGVFLEIGYEVKTDLIKDLLKLNNNNEIIIDEKCNTSVPGIFAAGDCTSIPYKQAVISAAEGVKAALTAYSYLTGIQQFSIDWNK